VTRNTCMRFASANGAEVKRIMAASPRTYASTLYDWIAYAAPAPEVMGSAGALWVAIGSGSPAVDLDIAPTFHDPFTGMTLLVESAAIASFNVQLPNAAPLAFPNITRRFALAERGNPSSCTPAKTVLGSAVSLATDFTLDGIPLDSDGKVVAIDTADRVVLSWTPTDGPVDYYSISVQELQVVNGATTNIARAGLSVAGQTTARLDPALFVPGTTYIIAVSSSVGRPNVVAGDWQTLQLPTESATMWSHPFQIQAL
jgi:hypothetical protein